MASGLPHFRLSQASMQSFEPIYNNLFEVRITAPAAIRTGTPWENTQLILDNVISVTGLGQIEKIPAVVEQKYKGVTRSYAGALPPNTYADIQISFELNLDNANSAYVYKALKAWTDIVYNPLTGELGLKSEYAGTSDDPTLMTVLVYNKKGVIIKQITFRQVFPTTALTTAFENLSYDNGTTIAKIDGFTFRADYWDNITR
jgi:hypothetical protein